MQYLFNINEEIATGIALNGQLESSKDFILDLLNIQSNNKKRNCIKNGQIIINNLYYSYNKDINSNVINNLNLVINDKEKIGLIGSSGSGKSTLMKILIGLYKIDEGEVIVSGHNIKDIDLYYLRQKIIYVNQRTNLFNTSIIDNIKYGNTNVSDRQIKDLITKYDLNHIYSKLPKKVYSSAGVNGGNLSLGMQKITIILRSLFKDGTIYIFDEPLAGLDIETKEKVIKMLINELKDKTILIITHDVEILPQMDRIIDLKLINNNL
jgi:ABC-type bacteriocin/lantibiotic exporter with double-glycine peptidase domain